MLLHPSQPLFQRYTAAMQKTRRWKAQCLSHSVAQHKPAVQLSLHQQILQLSWWSFTVEAGMHLLRWQRQQQKWGIPGWRMCQTRGRELQLQPGRCLWRSAVPHWR